MRPLAQTNKLARMGLEPNPTLSFTALRPRIVSRFKVFECEGQSPALMELPTT